MQLSPFGVARCGQTGRGGWFAIHHRFPGRTSYPWKHGNNAWRCFLRTHQWSGSLDDRCCGSGLGLSRCRGDGCGATFGLLPISPTHWNPVGFGSVW